MKRLLLTQFGLRHPWIVVVLALLMTAAFASRFPRVTFDNDPENMLAQDEPVRVFHQEVRERFALYDFVIVGIVNDAHEDGVFNLETLGRIDDLTHELISLHRADNGRPAVLRPARGDRPEQTIVPELRPRGIRKRVLARAFSHDPEDLFHEDGSSVIINREIMSPPVVDNIRQAELGQLKIEYLMETPPATRAEALALRDDAMANPLYNGTLVSADGAAFALYIPIHEKVYSYNVANLVEALTADWPAEDQVHITGLPVAEDTFGVEMLVQMTTSAPMAGIAIFFLLLFFFRRLSLVIAPMVVAVICVLSTMGLLIGLGFDVHIMSSMIAIFLMPIAVADSVHILSEFFDTYHRFGNKQDTVRHVIGHLFMPMLYTSLTTMAGFGSLALTPIPPVRVFGLHVAFGVGLAWLLSMVLIPAYIMLFVRESSLADLQAPSASTPHRSRLEPFLARLGWFPTHHPVFVLVVTVLVIAAAAAGITRIQVNDNPVKWFTPGHRIRVADHVLNRHFGGTYTAYLTLRAEGASREPADRVEAVRTAARERFAALPGELAAFEARLEEPDLDAVAASLDAGASDAWNLLADGINYLDPAGLTPASLEDAVRKMTGIDPGTKDTLLSQAAAWSALQGETLHTAALDACDAYASLSFREFLRDMEAELDAPAFKRPEVLAYLEALQAHLLHAPRVGKTSSAVDALKKANYELNFVEGETEARNLAFNTIPPTAAAVGQVFTQLEGMKKKDSLFHLVTRSYDEVNIWIQLTSGDNQDMGMVVREIEAWLEAHPAPVTLTHGWAGLTYINVVWQDKMVVGMLSALGGSFVVVLVMMMVLFRSPLFGLLSMLPLSVTIAFIYGLIGYAGKDYDMPAAVLSALTLGLSVDFAIHFLQRSRELRRTAGSWPDTVAGMFKEPAMAISRNAIIISIGFTPLLVAPLLPYRTVGFFLATIMAVSWLATLVLLTALVTLLQKWLFKKPASP